MADTSSSYPLDSWDLAPGEVKSQSPSVRRSVARRFMQCPPPSLDTQAAEFVAHHESCDYDSSVDSLAEFDLAPGEARSQSPANYFNGSQLPPCLPPTLDTEEFEHNHTASEDVWVVEDSLACWDLPAGEATLQSSMGDMDYHQKPFGPPPSLDCQGFGNNQEESEHIWMVEDSLACWDRTLDEAGSRRLVDHLSTSKPDFLRSPPRNPLSWCVDDRENKEPNHSTPVDCVRNTKATVPSLLFNKSSSPPTSSIRAYDSLENSKTTDAGAYCTHECRSPTDSLPIARKPVFDDSLGRQWKDANTRWKEEAKVDHPGPARRQGLDLVSSPPTFPLPSTMLRVLSPRQPASNSAGETLSGTSLLRSHPLKDVTNSKTSKAKLLDKQISTILDVKTSNDQYADRCPNSSLGEIIPDKKYYGLDKNGLTNSKTSDARFLNRQGSTICEVEALINKCADGCPKSSHEKVSFDTKDYELVKDDASTHQDSRLSSLSLTDDLQHPQEICNASNNHEVDRCATRPEVDSSSLVQDAESAAKDHLKQTLLDPHFITTKKRGQPDRSSNLEGWHCPKAGKRYAPASKQLSLDRWLA